MTTALLAAGVVYAVYLIIVGLGAAYLEITRKKRNLTFNRISVSPSVVSATVVVPVRNESQHITRCIESLKSQTLNAEILVVDDHSDDDTRMLAQACGVRVLTAEGWGKKAALTTGIAAAGGQIVLTIDGDAHAPPGWVEAMLNRFDESTVLVAGAVRMETGGTWFGTFQALESAGLMGLAGGGFAVGFPHLANGANLAFRKSAFVAVGGYGKNEPASGDDMFVVEKMRKCGRLRYVWEPNAVVSVPPCATFKEFWHQRLRWAGKNRRYRSAVMAAIQLSALAAVLGIFAAALEGRWLWAMGAWTVKSALEFLPLWPAARLLKRSRLLILYPAIQIFYPFYIAVFGTAALFAPKYVWKGRRLR
jgi:cellulose synthase/poly-beta-1,6-N-acetylglucosamine synthase-like glycosyltransferase